MIKNRDLTRLYARLVNPYVQPVLYVRRPGSDYESMHRFADDDPFFSEVSVLIDNIEDIEEDPETSQILSTFEGECLSIFSSLPFLCALRSFRCLLWPPWPTFPASRLFLSHRSILLASMT